MTLDDRDVLDRWRAGDQTAGHALFTRHFDPLYRFFANKCGEPDELIQATFLAIVKAKEQFEGRSSFRTYLFTVARHELYRHIRELKRSAACDPALSSIADMVTGAGSRLARHEEHRALFAALRTLPLDTQTLVELHYWEHVEAPALAEIFDVPTATIRMRLNRARTALREAMHAASGAPPDAMRSEEDLERWARTVVLGSTRSAT